MEYKEGRGGLKIKDGNANYILYYSWALNEKDQKKNPLHWKVMRVVVVYLILSLHCIELLVDSPLHLLHAKNSKGEPLSILRLE